MEGFGALDDARGLGRASGSLAILAEARGQVVEAQTRYEQALDRLRQAGDTRSEAIFLINLGDLHLEQDRVAEAEARYARALDLLDALNDRRVRAVLLGNLGAVDQRAGRLDAAIARRTEAIDTLQAVGDQRLAAVFRGYRGTAHHEAADDDAHRSAARADYDQAIAALMQVGDQRFAGLFSAHRAVLHADEGRLNQLADHPDAGIAAVVAIHRGQAVDTGIRGVDVAFARRLRGETDAAAGAALKVSPEADWLHAPNDEPRDIRRRHTLRRLLRTFVDAREQTPGKGLPMDALITAGWPDERILPHAAANRVYVAIATLRKLGLRDVLVSHEDGYLLDPATPLVRVPRPA
jgi:tetratricopeptide (TPR) repeat protein